MIVKVKQPSREEIKPYGQVIELPATELSTFSADHFSYWKQQAVFKIDGAIEVGVLHVKRHEMIINQMERHDKTTEILIPLNGDFIISVAERSGKTPNSKDLKAFKINKGQAILLKENCWHWMPCPVQDEITILVLFKDNTSANDLIIEDLNETCYLKN